MISEAFVYVWTNSENKKFYIGKHRGSATDGYISSGKYFLAAYHSAPHLFSREIVFWGTEQEALQEESRRIRQAITDVGYQGIYNLTTWQHLSQWKRTCLHCGAFCCPENEQWALLFEDMHFDRCSKRLTDIVDNVNHAKKTPTPKYNESWRLLTKEQRKILKRRAERVQWWKDNGHRFKK